MPDTFHHGVKVLEITDGPRPIQTVRSSVIAIIGTAPDADASAFPVGEPVLVAADQTKAALLDTTGDNEGSLPKALKGIFGIIGAVVVVIRVTEGADDAETIANVSAAVPSLLGVQSKFGYAPRILIAPGYTHQQIGDTANAVVAALSPIADRLRAVIVADGPNDDYAASLEYAGDFGSKRIYLVDPWVKVQAADGSIVSEPPSARVAGEIAKSDNERGFWWSPSNREIGGIVGTSRAIAFALGDSEAEANLLNENNVATIIRQNGFRLWGNRTLSADSKYAFLSVVRTADIINDSILEAHLWAVDRNITKTYLQDVSESVNAYLRTLTNLGAILGGRCWPDPDLNSPANLAAGKVYFNIEFTPPTPAESITFRSQIVNDYLEDIV